MKFGILGGATGAALLCSTDSCKILFEKKILLHCRGFLNRGLRPRGDMIYF
jgi:hypothetical protein